ncbi:MAG: hypothetical protein M1827_000766 [Pycnora praestabilis]|nr:MAG: hypothetical protein M1827_000766 [Pycnora praestabilis]
MRAFYISNIVSLATLAATNILSGHQNQQEFTSIEEASEVFSRKISLSPLLSLHRDLVKIQSITGNEHHVGTYLINYLKNHNFTVEKQLVSSAGTELVTSSGGTIQTKHDRFNIVAYKGKTRKTRTLVTSHVDTVPPYWPYEVRGEDDIWGRGSVDAKGSIAAQIQAVEDLINHDQLKEGDVSLLFVVGEETGGDGMRAANALGLEWETVIFGEPTELKLASGHKGNVGFSIKAKGKAGHSGYPELGINANSVLIRVLAMLDVLELPSSEKYGNTTLNIGRIEGGVAGNVIAESAIAQIQIRIAKGTATKIKNSLLDAIEITGEEDKLVVAFVSEGYGPVDIDTDVKGFETIVVNYGTDIPNLQGQHKRYLYGPGNILVAHSDHEHLSVSDLEAAVEGYKSLIIASLSSKK